MQGPVQWPREKVQEPCARATIPINRNGCKGHLDMCKGHNQRYKGLCCVQGPHLWPIYPITNDKQYNLVQGPQLEVQGPLMCARASSLANLPNYQCRGSLLCSLAPAGPCSRQRGLAQASGALLRQARPCSVPESNISI